MFHWSGNLFRYRTVESLGLEICGYSLNLVEPKCASAAVASDFHAKDEADFTLACSWKFGVASIKETVMSDIGVSSVNYVIDVEANEFDAEFGCGSCKNTGVGFELLPTGGV